MKKQIAIILLVCLLCQLLASCGGGSAEITDAEKQSTSEITTDAPADTGSHGDETQGESTTVVPSGTTEYADISTSSPETQPAQTEPAATESAVTTPAVTEPAVTEHVHAYGTEWKNDAYSHWHLCSCGEKFQFAAHSFGEWVVTKAATEQISGAEYRICSTCGYRENHTIPKIGHTHTFGTEWQNDDTKHWHLCSCGEKGSIANHSFGQWIVDKEANCTEAGSRHHVFSLFRRKIG